MLFIPVPHSLVRVTTYTTGTAAAARVLPFFLFCYVSQARFVPIVLRCMVAVIIYDSFCPQLVSCQVSSNPHEKLLRLGRVC